MKMGRPRELLHALLLLFTLISFTAARVGRLVAPPPSGDVVLVRTTDASGSPILAVTFPCTSTVPRVMEAIRSHLRIWDTRIDSVESALRTNASQIGSDELIGKVPSPTFGSFVCPPGLAFGTLAVSAAPWTAFEDLLFTFPPNVGRCGGRQLVLGIAGVRYLDLVGRLVDECGPVNARLLRSLDELTSTKLFHTRRLAELRIFNPTTMEEVEYRSQIGQDVWVAETVFPDVPFGAGYFVELGGVDGIVLSNTFALERARGWQGVLIEASDEFLRIPLFRRCRAVRALIGARAGEARSFSVRGEQGMLSGVPEHFSSLWATGVKEELLASPLVTRTLTDVLVEVRAPRFVHYVSIDVEGLELEVLQGLDLARFEVGAFTIEHNFQEPLRSDIRRHLEAHGYVHVLALAHDDCYLHPRVLEAVRGRWAAQRARRGGVGRRVGFGGVVESERLG